MAVAKQKPKKDRSPVERAIASRESGISRMRENIRRIKESANAAVEQIEARIKEKQFLLDALKRGQISA